MSLLHMTISHHAQAGFPDSTNQRVLHTWYRQQGMGKTRFPIGQEHQVCWRV